MESSITIQANESGRLWSEDPAAWRTLCAVEGCPICGRLASGDGADVVAATNAVIVTAEARATLPGYVCVTSRHHVVEPFDLSPERQSEFFLDAMAVAQGLARACHPVKMNYEIHGNTLPHLHMHLFPRQPEDAYVGFVITSRVWFTRRAAEVENLAHSIRRELSLRDRLTAWP